MNSVTTIYEHLVRMCEYRGAQVTQRIEAGAVPGLARSQPYITIDAIREDSDIRGAITIKIIYLPARDGSSSDKISPQISKIIKQYDTESTRTNLIFVTDVAISTQAARSLAEHNARDGNVFVEHHMSSIFAIIVPEHSAVPRHTIVGVRGGRMSEDIQKISREMHISLFRDLPSIIASTKYTVPVMRPDPVAVWLGMRPGMIIAIERLCETAAGLELTYRRTI